MLPNHLISLTFLSSVIVAERVLPNEGVVEVPERPSSTLDLWTWKGMQPDPHRLFTAVTLVLNLTHDEDSDYGLYQSTNRTNVLDSYENNGRFLGLFRKFKIWKSTHLDPFQQNFIGVDTKDAYSIGIKITHVDIYRLIPFIAGIILFFNAHKVARSVEFYYAAGCSVGLAASILLLFFFLHKILPKKSLAYSFLIGGWSFSLYILYYLWQNLYTILLEYQKWVGLYIITVLLASFAFCYRFGPIANPRTLNLSQWALQMVSLALIYSRCQIPQISISLIFSIIVLHFLPDSFYRLLFKVWAFVFPPKIRLLTEEEYLQQGAVETRKALNQLKEHCRSVDCDAWHTISKLKDPSRFASFVEGDSHLTDGELLNYDLDAYKYPSSDDDDEDDDGDILEKHPVFDHQNSGRPSAGATFSNPRDGGPSTSTPRNHYNQLSNSMLGKPKRRQLEEPALDLSLPAPALNGSRMKISNTAPKRASIATQTLRNRFSQRLQKKGTDKGQTRKSAGRNVEDDNE